MTRICAGDRSGAFGGDSAFRSGAPEEIRTPDPQIRSLVLYPAELRARLAHSRGKCSRTKQSRRERASSYRVRPILARLARLCAGLQRDVPTTPVTRGLDHASRIYPTCALEVAEIGFTRFRVVHRASKDFLRRRWIAGLCPAMTNANSMPRSNYFRKPSPRLTPLPAPRAACRDRLRGRGSRGGRSRR